MISKKFLTSSLVYTVSSTLSTVASFLLLPFYTNTNLLTVSDVGALSLYIGFSLLVQLLAGLSLDYYLNVVYHEMKEQPDELKKQVAALNGYLVIAGMIIIFLLGLSGNFLMNVYFKDSGSASFRYLMMSVFTGIFNAHFKFYNSLLINREKPWRYFWSNILNFFTTVVFSILILRAFPLTLEGPMWGRLLSCACIFCWSFADVTYTYGIAFNNHIFKPVFKFCWPLMVSAIFQWVLGYSSVYIIKPLLFNKEVAIFDLAVRFTLLINFLFDGISSAMLPKVFSLLRKQQTADTQKEINKYYSSFNLLSLILIPLNIFLLPLLLPVIISSENYLQAFLYFGIVSAGIVTRSIMSLFVYPIHFHKQTSKLLWVNGISAVMQLAISYLFILHFKLYGAAFALNIAKVLQLLLFVFFCSSLVTPGFNIRKMVWLPFIGLVLICVGEMFITGYGLRMHFIHALEMLVIFLMAWIFYKNEIVELVKWGMNNILKRAT